MNDAGAGQADSTARRETPPAASADASPPADSALTSDDSDVALQWTSRDRWFLAIASALILALLAVQFVRLSGWGVRPLEVIRPEDRKYEFQIDVNTASWVEWMQLDGIGEATARKIVADREANGPFQSVEDVLRVKGIGPATLEKMRPWLVCERAIDR